MPGTSLKHLDVLRAQVLGWGLRVAARIGIRAPGPDNLGSWVPRVVVPCLLGASFAWAVDGSGATAVRTADPPRRSTGAGSPAGVAGVLADVAAAPERAVAGGAARVTGQGKKDGVDRDGADRSTAVALTTTVGGGLTERRPPAASGGSGRSAAGGASERGGDNSAGSGHWAFIKPARPVPPAILDGRRPDGRNPVDAFIAERLSREGLPPSPAASRGTLVRRLYLDLTGLPPSWTEVDRFVRDSGPDAWERLVDRVLALPAYGERWGRHWLDLARYADSDGYEKDGSRPFAYVYRDWVVRALNADMPLDRFAFLQIAGDLESAPGEDGPTAVGFQRNTLTNLEGGVDPEEDRTKQTVDRVNTLGTAWLGLTVGCSECHDHKYDPISQRDYFSLYAFFNSITETNIPNPTPGEVEHHRYLVREWEYAREDLAASVDDLIRTRPKDDPEIARARESLVRHEKAKPAPPARAIPSIAERPSPRATRIHVRGDFLRPGAEVSRGVPAAFPALGVGPGEERHRGHLARWLTHPDHPLVARVLVNRIWQHLFGRGIVSTPNDFGTRGAPPSHAALLDWLATELVQAGWSQKALIRCIVTSATYRQSSQFRPEIEEKDPENVWIHRQHRLRLEAEAIRDSILSVTDRLDMEVGGPTVRPPLPPDVTEIAYAGQIKWPVSPGAGRYRRSIYIALQRTVLFPMFTTFDAPDAVTPCARRERSNTPLQALALLNDPFFVDCAGARAREVAAMSDLSERQRRGLLFRQILQREPSPEEGERLGQFAGVLSPASAPAPGDPTSAAAPWTALIRVLINLEEFYTRE